MAERMKVSGFRRPVSEGEAGMRRARVWLVEPRNMIWVAVLAGLPVIVAVWGTPHMLMNYTYEGTSANRTYITCQYIGYRERVIHPSDGQCPIFRLLKDD